MEDFEYSNYRGNTNLKRIGTQIKWTPDLIEEYIKCKNDVLYFSEKYVKVITLNEGFTSIKLYDYQKDIIQSFNDNARTIVATSRQVGKTTTAVCLILHYILFNKDVKVGILANKADSAKEVLERIQLAYEALPMWLQQGVVQFNKSKIILENKSQVIAAATTSSAIRGKTVNVLYIDEAAFVERWDFFWTSVYPTISSGNKTKVLFTSTPNGLNHFHKFWVDAAKKDTDPESWNGYTPIRVAWQEVPGRTQAWADDQLKALSFDTQKFAQEFEVEFLGSSGTLISGAKLKALSSIMPIRNNHEGLMQYQMPIEGHTYVLVADVSHGKGLDYSAFQIIDVTEIPYHQVCVFRSNLMLATDYADLIFRIGMAYNLAQVLVENNDIGATVPDMLHNDYEYENIIYTKNVGAKGKTIFFGPGSEKGIRTTVSVKSIGCSMIKMLIEQDKLLIYDQPTIDELSAFSKKGKSYEAEAGKHDDLVMPLVLFGWMTNQLFFKEVTDKDILHALREKNLEQLESEMMPFGFIQDGTEDFDVYEDFF